MKVSDRNRTDDLEKLAHAFYKNLEIDIVEFGGIGLDSKRPFGNSDVCEDILRIIGWAKEGREDGEACYTEAQKNYVYNLYHRHLIPFLRKNWLMNWECGEVAETAVRRMSRDDSYRAKLAMLLADEIFDNLEKPAKYFFQNLNNFHRHWEEIRNEQEE